MLRNRSRAVTTKQALMADSTSLLSPTKNPSAISSFLGSPRFFNGFLTKNLFDKEATVVSPTSILDTKISSSFFVNTFGYDRKLPKTPNPSTETNHSANKPVPEAIGLALIDSIIEEKSDKDDGNFSKPVNRTVLFGSKLKVQIPVINPPSSVSPVESPADFGIKTRSSHSLSPFRLDFARQLSLREMEVSEDYTCVITHGPNPKTTHIFDDCIVESRCGYETDFFDEKKPERGSETCASTSPTANFLGFCHTCKDTLGQGRDTYIYRGEKAFCSHECRCQEMLYERMKNPESDDAI